MREAVRAAWIGFNEPHEGKVGWLYLDRLGLVTTGMGNLVDASPGPIPWAPALSLALRHPDGRPALAREIKAAWLAVKALANAKVKGVRAPDLGGGHEIFQKVSNLRLSPAAVEHLILSKLEAVDAQLAARFGVDYEGAPSDGQLGLLSMAWAMGDARFKDFPKFCGHVRAGRWDEAADESLMQPNAGTLADRNVANRTLFRNAARVVADDLCPDTLFYPQDLSAAV